MKNTWKITLLVLLLTAIGVWLAVFSFSPKKLKLIACDVGQGDAILVVYGSFEILTDGGPPNGKVSECLSRYMPFWDREIEVVVNTHPQLDHYGGLIEVFKNYKVGKFVANSLDSSSQEYGVLKSLAGSRGVEVVTPITGLSINYGLIHYDIFFPTDKFLMREGWNGQPGKLGTFETSRDPNDFSVQAVLSFGKFRALLTGDIGDNMSEQVLPEIPDGGVNYIKIPHHGSKYGLTEKYLEKINPSVAVISVAAKNRYGHPAAEIIKMLKEKGIKILRTDEVGNVVVESDGNEVKIVE